MDYDALAAQFGGTVEPSVQQQDYGIGKIMEGLSPKDQAEMRQKVFAEGQKRIDGLRDITAKGASVISDLEQFHNLNKQESTGSAWQQIAPKWGFLHSDNTVEMDAIQSKLGPSQRVEGSGSSSDRDVNLFMRGLPSVEKSGPANQKIKEDYQRQYNYALDKQSFLSDYLNKNGHLMGADEQWGNHPSYKKFMNLGNPDTRVKNDRRANVNSPQPAGGAPAGGVRKYNPATGKLE